MRLGAILREAARDIATGTTRFAGFSILLAIAISGLVSADGIAIARQIAEAEDFREAGGSTQILTAEGRIDPAQCERLGDLPDVVASGALRSDADKVRVSVLPNAPVPSFEVSPGFADVLSARSGNRSGTLISRDLALDVGAQVGESIATDRGSMTVASTFAYPSDGRRPGLGYAVLSITADPGGFDECWVTAWPQLTNVRALLFGTMTPGSDPASKPQISQLNTSHGLSVAGEAGFLGRLTRAAVPVAAMVGVGLGFVSVRLRRLQLASALHAGVRRVDLISTQLLQALAWASSAAVIGLALAGVTASFVPGEDQGAVFEAVSGIPLAAAVGAVGGAFVATLSAREKQLYRYFAER
ncbi:hypothetical protein IT072_15860 [Leifsonia sp. ZF2019]|uniref:hypothetical protein n=1 Tax=Leifsonia sp. ZF2019 TaxID=2781978 RepID=UPI001CC15D9A|nr:hypothetical protein [Leifsonia sp. ZF2019]UAJ78693.1 hypothetical protein IT072_15860 [Leifsonia sp. ZF2019]